MSGLVVGGDGLIGRALTAALGSGARSTSRRAGAELYLDLAQPGAFHPPAVDTAWLCAGVARIAEVEADPSGSAAVNVEGSVSLAERLIAAGSFVVYLSTNLVFDGGTPVVRADAAA